MVFVVTRETGNGFETLIGSLRPVEGTPRYETLFLRNNELYRSHVFAARALAEQDLAMAKTALEAAGFTPQP